MNKRGSNFKLIRFSIVYSFDKIKDHFDTLNRLIIYCLNKHAPLKKVRFTREPVLRMKVLDITESQQKRNDQRYKARHSQVTYDWENLRQIWNNLKQKIEPNTIFHKKKLSSENSNVAWKTIHRMLKLRNPWPC